MKNCEIFRKVRKKRGWTQEQMSNYLGIQREIVSFWERNKRPIPADIAEKMRQIHRRSKDFIFQELTLKNVTTSISNDKIDGSKSTLLHSLGEKHTKKEGVSDKKKPEIDIPLEGTIEYHLLDGLIAFKRNNNNRYPTTQDFRDGKIKSFSLHEIKEFFGNLRHAKRVATALRKQRRQIKKKETKLRSATNQCSICGNWYRGVEQHFDDMRDWINSVLSSVKGDSYQDIVLQIREKILFPSRCFCGGQQKKCRYSPLRSVINSRLENLFQHSDGRSPHEAASDCKKAIFDKNLNPDE